MTMIFGFAAEAVVNDDNSKVKRTTEKIALCELSISLCIQVLQNIFVIVQ
jgi:hypothetical protein